MKYLEDFGFTNAEIKKISDNSNHLLVNNIIEFQDLIIANLTYLRNIGVGNFKDIFCRHAEVFLLDNSKFEKIFSRYDQEDLVVKLRNNPDLIEQL